MDCSFRLDAVQLRIWAYSRVLVKILLRERLTLRTGWFSETFGCLCPAVDIFRPEWWWNRKLLVNHIMKLRVIEQAFSSLSQLTVWPDAVKYQYFKWNDWQLEENLSRFSIFKLYRLSYQLFAKVFTCHPDDQRDRIQRGDRLDKERVNISRAVWGHHKRSLVKIFC